MISAGTSSPAIGFDHCKDEPGMILQREYRERGKLIWRDVVIDGQFLKSPVDLDALPAGRYRLVE